MKCKICYYAGCEAFENYNSDEIQTYLSVQRKVLHARVSGVARTVRGPSMSCEPGKVSVMSIVDDIMILPFLQARNPKWIRNPFFAKLDPNATWSDDLKPHNSNEKEFFYQKELNVGMSSGQMTDNSDHWNIWNGDNSLNIWNGINGLVLVCVFA